ncbi:uncharacterized protein GLRG_09804, partial [Colletotrichum graminicola M1.001]
LASRYWKQGRLGEAKELGVLVLEISKVLGDDHPDTILRMKILASISKEAEDLELRVIIEIEKNMAGEDTTDLVTGMEKPAFT